MSDVSKKKDKTTSVDAKNHEENNSHTGAIIGSIVVATLVICGTILVANHKLTPSDHLNTTHLSKSGADTKTGEEKIVEQKLENIEKEITDIGTLLYANIGGKENIDIMKKIVAAQDPKEIRTQLEQQLQMMEGATNAAGKKEAQATPVAANVPKTERPQMDLFIMSECPFGTQAQKAYLPIMEKFRDVADVNVKFVHYLMHGEEEARENTRQYCIQKDEPQKYIPYMTCYLEAKGKSPECLESTQINKEQLDACMKTTDEQFGLTQAIADAKEKQERYPRYPLQADEAQSAGVQGSPSVVINGVKVDAGRNALAYKEILCNAFLDDKKPEVCNEEFSSTTYDPGYGWTSNRKNTGASCGG